MSSARATPATTPYEVFQADAPQQPVRHRGRVAARSAAAALHRARQLAPATQPGVELWLIPAAALWHFSATPAPPAAILAEPAESVQQAEAYARGEADYAVFRQPSGSADFSHLGMVRAASAAESEQQAQAVFGAGQYWLAPWAAVQVVRRRA